MYASGSDGKDGNGKTQSYGLEEAQVTGVGLDDPRVDWKKVNFLRKRIGLPPLGPPTEGQP